MKYGVKIGPENWQEALAQTGAEYCELWFRVDQEERFGQIFKHLQSHNLKFGLHFWAVLSGGYEPNLAFEPNGVADQTQELIARNIDIAKRVGAHYVNVHPGSLLLHKLDLDRKEIIVLPGREISESGAWESLLRRSRELEDYAKEKDVLFLMETLPKNEPTHFRDATGRLEPQEAGNIAPELVVKLAKAGILVTNDFGHTPMGWEGEDRDFLFAKLLSITKELAPQTRLIHLNTVVPPFNGTDSHNGILEKDFASGAFPNREQIIELLRIFKDRDDVWVIPEAEVPDMTDNYFAIEKLFRENNF